MRAYLQLSRFDRPVGFWLLALPCLIGVAFMRLNGSLTGDDLILCAVFLAGAVAMRGAGCTYNDILDRKIDGSVARTAGRPIPSGRVSLRGAFTWLVLQLGMGFVVLLLLPRPAQIIALMALPLVALYPFMKRITWWPQAWLGLTFNWGVLVAVAALAGDVTVPSLVLYFGFVFWTLGYDTIYALQDREDDALIGVRSTALRFGRHVRLGVAAAYAAASVLVGVAAWMQAGPLAVIAATPFMGHLVLQIVRLDAGSPARALMLFRSNRDAAGLLFMAWAFFGFAN